MSVKRPTSSGKRKSHNSNNIVTSICTIRNVILFFIVVQTISLMFKIVSKTSSNDDKQTFRRRPDILIEKEEHPLEDPHEKHTDHDPHEVVAAAAAAGVRQQLSTRKNRDNDEHEEEEELPEPDRDEHEEEEELPKSARESEDDIAFHGGKTLHGDHKEVLKKHGTGPTRVGYVVDLVYERMHAAFRQVTVPEPVTRAQVANLLAGQGAKPCEYWQNKKLLEHAICRDKDTPVVVYNTATFPRSICGHVVEPGQAVKLDEYCEEPVHLFPNEQDAPATGKGMPPIIVHSEPAMSKDTRESLKDIECDIPCKFESDIGDGMERYIDGTKWKILQSMKDPYMATKAKVERTAYRHDVYYSTTSFKSSVPLSFYSFDKYDMHNTPILHFDDLQPKATYLLDDQCSNSPIRRQKWYAAVEAAMPTESYGSCHHNTNLGSGETLHTEEGRIKLMQKNLITLAFEAGNDKDHITPIVWEALMSGAVPAILGASNLGNHLPENSFIHTGDFNNWDKFAEFLKKVVADKKLWYKYQDWRRNEEKIKKFDAVYNFTRTSPECRMCRWAYAKKYGLGWDHSQQVVKENYLPRKLCVDKKEKLATHPFQEIWGSNAQTENDFTCFEHSESSETTVQLNGASITRTIVHHDGVTDIYLKNIEGLKASESVALRIKVAVQNSEGAYFRDTHTLVPSARNPLISSASIQDENSKVTVLANWQTKIASPEEGVIQLNVDGISSDDEVRRIRVIGEDMSELHDKMTEYFPSSFGKMMIFDFVEPLEMFYVDGGSTTK